MTLNFTGVVVESLDMKLDPKGMPQVRIHLTADLTQEVREKMGWPNIPEQFDWVALIGELAASSMILTPGAAALGKYEVEIDITSIGRFEALRIEDDGDIVPASRRKLCFIARATAADTEALIGAYLRKIGSGTGNLAISYTRQAVLGE